MFYLDAQGGPVLSLTPQVFLNKANVEVGLSDFALPAADRIELGIWTLQDDPQPDLTQVKITGYTISMQQTTGEDEKPSVMLRHWTTVPLSDADKAATAAAVLALAISLKSAEIDQKRDAMFAAGIAPTGTEFQGKTCQLDEVSQGRITAAGANAKLALLAAQITNTPPTLQINWIMLDNSTITLDAAGMSSMADQAMAAVQKWVTNARLHKNTIGAMTDPAEVNSYDFSGGW